MRILKKTLATALAVTLAVSSVSITSVQETQAAAATSIKVLFGKKANIEVGETFKLVLKVSPSSAGVTYKTSNKKIAKVSKKGVIKGVKPGKATITIKAKEGSKKATAKVTVKPKQVKSVKVATTTANDSALVSWKAQKNVKGYKILASKKKNKGYKTVATVKGAKKTSATVTGLDEGATYYFKVRAYSGKINGELSKAASVKLWKLVWADEFNYTDKAKVEENWAYEIGNGTDGWGNNEIQYYTKGDNIILDGNNLIIQPKYEKIDGKDWYTSTRLVTKGKKTFKYGKIEFNVKVPSAQGTWAATWMLGTGSNGSWPNCGEIDIMETLSNTRTGIFAKDSIPQTIHNGRFNGMPTSPGCKNKVTTVPGSTEGFHTYGIIWNEDVITFTIDGKETWTYDPSLYGTPTNLTWPFKDPAYLIMNVAIGGTLGGSIVGANGIEKTILDQAAITGEAGRMYCDWVRVYQ